MATSEIPMRPFGRSDVKVSALGVGGHHLGDLKTVTSAIQLVHEALDAGITFFDNCWEYHNGRSENWMGRGLKGRRDKVFLMTKVCTHGRGKELALQMLEESLRRLQTDHLDLWQIHGVTFDNDPELAYRQGRRPGSARPGQETGQGPLRRLHRPQGPGDPSEDARTRLSVRLGADAAQPLRRQLPQFRETGSARGQQARHGGARHEEHGRHRRADQEGRGQGGGNAALRHEPAGDDDHRRHGRARRAAAKSAESPADSSR